MHLAVEVEQEQLEHQEVVLRQALVEQESHQAYQQQQSNEVVEVAEVIKVILHRLVDVQALVEAVLDHKARA
jgi:hypothetical protein